MADLQPIIVKKIKKGGHAHHGGAWKVAYADFVTAMMAFFLLLWLLNVTSPEQKMGLAEYFTPTIGVKDSMGIGFKGGLRPTQAGRSRNDLSTVGLVSGQPKQGPAPGQPSDKSVKADDDAENTAAPQKEEEAMQPVEDAEQFKEAATEIKQSLEKDPELKDYQDSVVVQDTPEGLKIDIIDDQKKPMFLPGSSALTDQGKKVLDSMSNIVVKTPNNIQISGHTDAATASMNPQYTNWELSADRANTARRFLGSTQLEPDRVAKVVGFADRELLVPQEPTNPRNRRITLLLMRGSYFRDPKSIAPTTRTLLSVPDAKIKKPEEELPPPPVQEDDEPSMFLMP